MGTTPFTTNAISTAGAPESGAKLFSYRLNTTTPQAVYRDIALTTPATNPVIANATGRVLVYLNNALDYRLVLKSANEADILLEVEFDSASKEFSVTGGTIGNYNNLQSALSEYIEALGDLEIDPEWAQIIADPPGPGQRETLGAPVARVQLMAYVPVAEYSAIIARTSTYDCADAFDEAIADLGFGGTLELPDGTVMTSRELVLPATAGDASGIILQGVGAGSVISPLGSMDQIIKVVGGLSRVQQVALTNISSRAARGILQDSSDDTDDIGSAFADNWLTGFATGIETTGDNNMITGNFFNSCTKPIYVSENGLNGYIEGNYSLGGAYGVHITHTTQQAEGLRILNNTFLPTASGAKGIHINGGFQIVIADNIIDQVGANGIAVHLDAGTIDHQIKHITVARNWLAGGAGVSGRSIKAANNNIAISVVENTLVGGSSTVGADLNGVTYLRFERNQSAYLTGAQAAFVACQGTVIANGFEGAGAVTEDAACALVWRYNRGNLPSSRSALSDYDANWGDDISLTTGPTGQFNRVLGSGTGYNLAFKSWNGNNTDGWGLTGAFMGSAGALTDLANSSFFLGGRQIGGYGVPAAMSVGWHSTTTDNVPLELLAGRPATRVERATTSVNRPRLFASASGAAIEYGAYGSDTNIDVKLAPKGSGVVQFGTHSALAAETVTGYITVKDAAGNIRKLAVVS